MAFVIRSTSTALAVELDKHMTDEFKRGNVASLSAMKWAADQTKGEWRGQVRGAGLGNRLSNAIRAQAYQNAAKPSIGAWALVWSKAPKITAAHEQGALIKSTNGFWLAIPTAAAGRGTGNGKITPSDWERRNGRVLRFVYRKGRTGLLIDEGRAAPGNVMVRRRSRGGDRLAAPRTFRNRSIVMFVLVPQAKLKKKLDLFGAADKVSAALPARIAALWK